MWYYGAVEGEAVSDHQHIVPRGYLRNFAVDGSVGMLLIETGERRRPSVADAGVRSDFYTRTRPSGEKSYDIEAVSIASVEDGGLPVLREIRQRWPLSGDEKASAAMFIGLQLVRGPRWMEWQRAFTKQTLEDFDADGLFAPGSRKHGVSEEEIKRAHADHFDKATTRLVDMLAIGAKAGSVLGSMHWSLLSFDRDLLGTSDHPVAVWPLSMTAREPSSIQAAEAGALNLLEVRFPVDPRTALLMSWQDEPDTPDPIDVSALHAWNLNSFSLAEAEKQWFYRPGTRPRAKHQRWLPLAPELFPGYSPAAAVGSNLRGLTARDANRSRRTGPLREDDLRCEIHYMPQPSSTAA